ncbi:MAG: carbohydrate porin [Planctomycetota bacterium]|jgi:porin
MDQYQSLVPRILVVLSLGAEVCGQTEGDKSEPTLAEVVTEATPGGLLPVPDYSGDWATRPALTGDWGGARQDLANKGLFFDVEWMMVVQGVVSGGLAERAQVANSFDYYVTLDLGRMGVVPNALVLIRGQSRFGDTVNGDTGLLLPVNTYQYFPLTTTLDDDIAFTVTELNYLQLLSDGLAVQVGKVTTMATSNEFAGGEGREQFMNFQLMFSSALALVAPYSTLAVGGVWQPSPHVTVSTTLMNTTDASTTTGFGDIGDGSTWLTSVDFQYRLAGLPGGMNVSGAYAFDGDFTGLGGLYIDPTESQISLGQESETWALAWSAWQYLFTGDEPPEIIDATDGRQDLQGLGLFAMIGIADEDTNPVSWSIAGGLSGRGMIPGRDDDTCGLGYFYNDAQDPDTFVFQDGRRRDSSQGFEAYYNIAIANAAALTLDLQWTRAAFAGIDDSVVLGMRLNLSF